MAKLRGKRSVAISVFCIVVITLFAFLPSLKNGFTGWDDDLLVTENSAIRDLSWHNIKTIFTSFYTGAYIPLTMLSYSLEYHFFKLNPRVYHTTNLIIHLLVGVLAFLLIYVLSNNILISLTTTLLFAIHPLSVESVAWIAGRKDVLYSFFYLGSLLLYLHYQKQNTKKFYWFSLFLFFLSLLSKGTAVTLPVVMFICDYLLHRNLGRKLILEKIPFFMLAFLFGSITVLGERAFGYLSTVPSIIFFERILFASYGLVFYLYKIVLPMRLSCYYSCPAMTGNVLPPIFYFSFVTVVFIVIGVIITAKYTRKIVFGFALFLIAILPYLQLIPTGQIIADRYTYIASIGLFSIVGEGFYWLYDKKLKSPNILKPLLIVVFAAIIGMLSILTFNRCKVWKDSITLWSDALEKYPRSKIARYNRAITYRMRGEYDKAITDFSHALRVDPNFARAYNDRGVVYFLLKEYDKAFADYTNALRIDQEYAEAYNNRGVIYIYRTEYDRAINEFNTALRFKPEYADAYYNRGFTFRILEQYETAIADFTEALRIDPAYVKAYHQRAIAYYQNKEYERAWQDVRMAESLGYPIDPNFLKDLIKDSAENPNERPM